MEVISGLDHASSLLDHSFILIAYIIALNS